MSQLIYLTRKELEDKKWNDCIDKSENGLIYARSYYLDSMACHWDAVIVGDYEAVFPIPWKKKWGFRYMYPPFFTQQLGLIGDSSAIELTDVLALVRKKFRYGECYLNFKNKFNLSPKNNFILPLNTSFDAISNAYNPKLRYDLRKASNNYQYTSNPTYNQILKLFRKYYRCRIPHVKEKDFEKLDTLLSRLQRQGELIVRSATKNNQVAAGVICLADKKRIYVLIAASTEEARQGRAMHVVIDNLIREFAGSPLILDFEGSDLPGVSHFYRSFGTVNQPYFFYKWNDLGFPWRLFKK